MNALIRDARFRSLELEITKANRIAEVEIVLYFNSISSSRKRV